MQYCSSKYRCPTCGKWALVYEENVTHVYEFDLCGNMEDCDDLEYGRELHGNCGEAGIKCHFCGGWCLPEDIAEVRDCVPTDEEPAT